MVVLGLGGSIHDFAACVVSDGAVVALEDERLTKVRYAVGSTEPCRPSSRYCLDAIGRSLGSVDAIAGNLELLQMLDASAFPGAKYMGHHAAHAYSAFFTSRFDDAAILVVDGAGSQVGGNGSAATETLTYARGCGNRIEVLGRVCGDLEGRNDVTQQQTLMSNSLGELYRAVAEAVGLGWLSGPGKAMGLAAYAAARGDDRFVEALARHVDLLPDGQFRIRMNGGDGLIDALYRIRQDALTRDDAFVVDSALAHAGQVVLETVMLHVMQALRSMVDSRNLCLAGGVALNSLANGRVVTKAGFERLHIFFAPGDSGTAIGAAIWAMLDGSRDAAPACRFPLTPFLGREYGAREIDDALSDAGLCAATPPDVVARTAALLAEGRVVAWWQGRSEFGPRALGNRCLLADPRRPHMRDHINLNIKGREWYRPLAPAVPADRAGEYFHCDHESPWMQFVWMVRDEVKPLLPAVTHVDGGARVQTVRREDNPSFYRLLEAFGDITGVPVLLNTSLNIRRRPIVETPQDAIRGFLESPIDVLVLGDRIVAKP